MSGLGGALIKAKKQNEADFCINICNLNMYSRLIQNSVNSNKSSFLFGPIGTGKETLDK